MQKVGNVNGWEIDSREAKSLLDQYNFVGVREYGQSLQWNEMDQNAAEAIDDEAMFDWVTRNIYSDHDLLQ